ncbi:hypothetical protein O181_009335 [Austropuccinia psidii MF-1]|uniref:Reverse transcriptase domain-containing protein n=1 Tax=Austropuccinia psidii MF-1 TaxID=1389203 RepID=A0A9Q3BRR5_9BASI|nr:hypothetical protein [Austropuccinia psidii MF-1]
MVEIPSFPSFEWDFLVIDTPNGEDLILGFDFLNHFNPFIDWRKGIITFNADHKSYYDPLKYFSNDFYLPNHVQLLDEVFKDIQDVGEDNSVSLLHLFFGNMDLPPPSYHYSLGELWDEEEETEEVETVMKVVPSVYHQYLDVFCKVKAEKLPPHCASAPVLFVKKKDGGLHLCFDYRKLNAVTRKNKYPVPTINQLLTVFNGSSIFLKIDLRGAYKLLRLKEGGEHSTAFRTKYGSCEYLVMPFGLTNAPASFQNLVNDIFYDLFDLYVVVYLDGIMVFLKSEEEHVTNVSTVPSRLRSNNLFSKACKCLLHLSSVEYLGYIVSSEGLKMDQANI